MNKKEIYDYLYNLFQEANEDMEILEWCPSVEKDRFLNHRVFVPMIYDLHSENFGVDKKGKFRIIDFSSFND